MRIFRNRWTGRATQTPHTPQPPQSHATPTDRRTFLQRHGLTVCTGMLCGSIFTFQHQIRPAPKPRSTFEKTWRLVPVDDPYLQHPAIVERSVSEQHVNDFVRIYRESPHHVRRFLGRNNIRLLLMDTFQSLSAYTEAYAIFVNTDEMRSIYLPARIRRPLAETPEMIFNTYMPTALLHESGHAVSQLSGALSATNIFCKAAMHDMAAIPAKEISRVLIQLELGTGAISQEASQDVVFEELFAGLFVVWSDMDSRREPYWQGIRPFFPRTMRYFEEQVRPLM